MGGSGYESASLRSGRLLLTVGCLLVLLFLVLPIVVTIPLSFSSSTFMRYPIEGFSLQWYERLFEDPQWRRAIINTLVVGVISSLLAVVLGTAAAYGVYRMHGRVRGVIIALAILPMIVPPIIIALGSYLFFLQTGIENGYVRVIIGHTIIGIPFAVLVVYSALTSLDPTHYRAALSLGARPFQAFRTAVLPRISRAMAGGGVLAFATSIDELIISMFVTTARERTLPVQMFSGLREQLSPVITAAATCLLLVSAVILLLASSRKTKPSI
jgi:putative spermidine/putrescine transport system permease protein